VAVIGKERNMENYNKKENYVYDFTDEWNRNHNKTKIVEQYFNLLHGKVAEMGCNSGYHCFIIAENEKITEVRGFDINEKSLTFADNKNRSKFPQRVSKKVKFTKCNLTKVDIMDSYFDLVISFHTLEHIYPKDLHSVLLEKYRVLKNGGKLLLSLPYLRAFDCNGHVNYFDLDKIDSELSKVGFIKEELYVDSRMGDDPRRLCITGVFKKNE
tara:strand:- start:3041 stop:3679 length:639 start_codon:yes stop_codon:yes gene_type:complete